jgi:hypothetical protein
MSRLREQVEHYLRLRRSLGYKLVEHERVLNQYLEYLEQSGHMGATPQPNRTVANGDNQLRTFSKSGVSNVNEGNQRWGESIDTVGVTGSIPVSPTTKAP